MSQPWDYIAKVVSLGDSGAGKSSLTVRLCEGRFSPHHDVTIGVEFGSRIVPVGPPASLALHINDPTKATSTSSANGAASKSTQNAKDAPSAKQKFMKLSLWDTAGQETYKSITRSYFRGASGALLVFDITRRATFLSATSWLHDLRQIAEDGIIVVLVGNKSDLAPSSTVESANGNADRPNSQSKNLREVTIEEAEEWCRQNKVMQYVETSAKSGEGVERAFREVAERIYQNIEAGKYDLNDRRSGVKAAASGNTSRTVNLGLNDVAAAKRGQKSGYGGCC
jgi:Ras-related protein Rab-2A